MESAARGDVARRPAGRIERRGAALRDNLKHGVCDQPVIRMTVSSAGTPGKNRVRLEFVEDSAQLAHQMVELAPGRDHNGAKIAVAETEQDRRRWNARYASRPNRSEPADSLIELAPLLRPPRPGARALDLACGTGRNALFLAELGYDVDAWDISDLALAALETELGRRATTGRQLSVTTRRVDLAGHGPDDGPRLPPDTYDLLIDYYYLDRSLFPSLAASLRPGDTTVLRPNMTFHCIPGVWQDGWGIEISAAFRVAPNGAERFSDFPDELVVKP